MPAEPKREATCREKIAGVAHPNKRVPIQPRSRKRSCISCCTEVATGRRGSRHILYEIVAGGISPSRKKHGMKQYIVRLTDEVRQQLLEAVQGGTRPVRVVRRALILLQAGAGLTDLQIVEHLGCAEGTVRNVRKRFCREGLEGALHESPRAGRPSDFTARQKQQIVALACADPPEGRARWTLELLCEHATRQGVVESISKSAVSLLLKTHDLKPWEKKDPVRN